MEQGPPEDLRDSAPGGAPTGSGSARIDPPAGPAHGTTAPGSSVPPPLAPPGRGPAPGAPGPALAPPPGWGGPAPAPGWGPAGGPLPPRRPGEHRPVVPLRPLGLGELLDGAVSVVRAYPRPVFAVAAAVAVVGAALELLVTLTLLRPLLELDQQELGEDLSGAGDALGSASVGLGIAALFAVFAGLLLTGLVAPAVSRGTLGQPLTPGELWQQLRPRLPALLGTALAVTLAIVLVTVVAVGLSAAAVAALGPPGGLVALVLVPVGLLLSVDLWVRSSFAPVCAVLEKQGVLASLARSRLLVRRSWWRVLGVLLLTALVSAVVGQVLQVPFLLVQGNPLEVLSAPTTTTTTIVLSTLGGLVAATVLGPFTAGVRGLLYVDRRMRAEGLDVALAAARASAAATRP